MLKQKVFFDSNILIYTYSNSDLKKIEVISQIYNQFKVLISTQVIQEFSNVMLKKFSIPHDKLLNAIKELRNSFKIIQTDLKLVEKAIYLNSKYKYSFYDSLIVSSALLNDCDFLITEDLNHNQLIEKKLRIVNPFKL
jgi:predicted nucleic acid-binding protein